VDDVLGPAKGSANVAAARKQLMYVLSKMGLSDTTIGEYLGRDRTTIAYGIKTYKAE